MINQSKIVIIAHYLSHIIYHTTYNIAPTIDQQLTRNNSAADHYQQKATLGSYKNILTPVFKILHTKNYLFPHAHTHNSHVLLPGHTIQLSD